MGPPYLIPNYLRVQKKRNPGTNGKVTMYSCLLPEFHVTGALLESPIAELSLNSEFLSVSDFLLKSPYSWGSKSLNRKNK